MKLKFVFFWSAVVLYGVSTFSNIFGLISKHEKLFTIGLCSAGIGFSPHISAIALRWMAGGGGSQSLYQSVTWRPSVS